MIIEKNLYAQIKNIMPIPCVDIIIVNQDGRILLAKRTNQPAQGEWWFPGGRIHYLETRKVAAVRKLQEECSLEAEKLVELGTFDVITDDLCTGNKSHGITTVFIASMGPNTAFILDEQNSVAKWLLPLDWLKLDLHPFIQQVLTIISQ
jgi:colanic acid biosynthesis protein WcaH